MARMKLSEIYRTAARIVAEPTVKELDSQFLSDGDHLFCCSALWCLENVAKSISYADHVAAKRDFSALFKPDSRETYEPWFGNSDRDVIAQRERTLALCFMSAIAADDERHGK